MGGIAVIDTCTIQNFININRFDLFERLKYYLFTTIYVELEIQNFDLVTKQKFQSYVKQGKIKNVPLTIEDLIEMANVPESKRFSDTELSCIVKARQINSTALTDDKRAVRFITKYLVESVIKGTKEILIEGYVNDFLNDIDLIEIQDKLKQHRFRIKENLLYEAAGEKRKLDNV